MVEKLNVTFELVTPAFAGAAYTHKTDGLRIPAIKALIRFWWRTMHATLTRSALHNREARIFGSADGRIGRRLSFEPGKSTVSRIDPPMTHVPVNDWLSTYFAYGPVAWQKRGPYRPDLQRGRPELVVPRLHPGTRVDVTLFYRHPKSENSAPELLTALWLLSAFGGYGGRSRRGWGSVRVGGLAAEWKALGLDDPHAQRSAKELRACLEKGIAICVGGQRSSLASPAKLRHAALSRGTRLVVAPKAYGDWKAALEQAADVYRSYRQFLGAKRDHRSVVGPDFALRERWMTSGPGGACPQGSAFGLPHNAKNKVEVGVGQKLDGRRASPLIIKVLKCGTGTQAIPLFLWLPGEFLPDAELHAAVVDRSHTPPRFIHGPTTLDYVGDAPIRAFFDGGLISQGSDPDHKWQGFSGRGWLEVKW